MCKEEGNEISPSLNSFDAYSEYTFLMVRAKLIKLRKNSRIGLDLRQEMR